MNVTFDHSQSETATITTFFFKPEKPVQYTAGQFIELTLPHNNADDRGTRRWFTLSSSPTSELLSITTKQANVQGSSFKRALWALEPGTQLAMASPMGDFVLPKSVHTPLVFVAGGIGITPFHSMLKWLADTGEERPIRLMYGVSTEDDIIFQDTFNAAGVEPVIVVSNPSPAWGGEMGHITAEMILGVEQPSSDTLVYLSGPEPLLESLQKDLQARGIDKRQIVTDFFTGYTKL